MSQALGDASPRFSPKSVAALMERVSLKKDSATINLAGFMDVMTHDDSRVHQKAGAARLSDALSNLNVCSLPRIQKHACSNHCFLVAFGYEHQMARIWPETARQPGVCVSACSSSCYLLRACKYA